MLSKYVGVRHAVPPQTGEGHSIVRRNRPVAPARHPWRSLLFFRRNFDSLEDQIIHGLRCDRSLGQQLLYSDFDGLQILEGVSALHYFKVSDIVRESF